MIRYVETATKNQHRDVPITKDIVNDVVREVRGRVHEMPEGEAEATRRWVSGVLLEKEEFQETPLHALVPLANRAVLALREDLYILSELAEDPTVTEIMVNGPSDIFVDRAGMLERVPMAFESRQALVEVIRRIAASVGREINELNPIVDARTREGFRVNGVYDNIALGGPILTIRKFPKTGFTMEDLIKFGTVTEDCAAFLQELVLAGYNIFISGGTSSGKTTFLNVLTRYIPTHQRVITIEDSAELRIDTLPNLVRLECRRANGEGRGDITMEQLIKTSLRMRPDRIIVGEVRGREVVDMINAMNTGHDGSLSTGHGNSVQGMVRRLESMFLQGTDFPLESIRGQIAQAIDIMIHLGRMGDGRRRVLEVTELREKKGDIAYNCLYRYDKALGLLPTGNEMQNTTKMELAGATNG